MRKLINFFKRKETDKDSSGFWQKRKTNNKYFCLMKCEEDKYYDARGTCPVCNMKLVSDENILDSVVRFRCNV
jgi:Cu2+-exporting ATPase